MFEPEPRQHDPFVSRTGKAKVRLDGQVRPSVVVSEQVCVAARRLRPVVPLTTALLAILVLAVMTAFSNS